MDLLLLFPSLTPVKSFFRCSETCINRFRGGITINYERTRKYHRGKFDKFDACFRFFTETRLFSIFSSELFPFSKIYLLARVFLTRNFRVSDNVIYFVDEWDIRCQLKVWRPCYRVGIIVVSYRFQLIEEIYKCNSVRNELSALKLSS